MNRLLTTPKIGDVVEFKQTHTKKIFKTKSGGDLSVLFALPFELVGKFFRYDKQELALVQKDIRGFRIYRVSDLSVGQIGGTEFHRIRQEIVLGLVGRIRWECEDLFGRKKEFVLNSETGIYMPPRILHTYYVEEADSGLVVVCNTLFPLPANLATNDTFSKEEFRALQKFNQP